MISFALDAVWTPDGWRDGVTCVVDADGDGCITTSTPATHNVRIGGAVVPGLVSLHSHAFQRGMAGLAEVRGSSDDSFWTWRDVMYRFLDRLTPDDIVAIAAMAYVEMVERGFTSVVEFHYLHHDIDGRAYADPAAMAVAIAQAADVAGIGLTLLPTYYACGGFGSAPATAGQRRFLSTRAGFDALVSACGRAIAPLRHARLGLALHSLRAVHTDDIVPLAGLLPDAPIHIHVAEQEREVADCLAWSGKRPVRWLLDHTRVDARWCLIHATHLDETERRDLAASGAVAGLCPVTEANLGDGLFPAVDYAAMGGRYGVGTDSNVLVSAAEELRTLEYGQRLRDRRRARLAPAGRSVGDALWAACAAGGAQASGRVAAGFVPGARADWIVLDDAAPTMEGARASLMDRAIFAAPSLPVREVWIGGRRIVADGRHRARDHVAARYRRVMRALMS